MKKYTITNWTFISQLLDDYRPWLCVLSIQTRNVMLVHTAVRNGLDCCYSRPTVQSCTVGLKDEDAVDGRRLCALCSGQSRLDQIRHVTPRSHFTPTGLHRFPAINRQFRYSVQLPTSSVTKHHWYPTAWSSILRHIGNYSAPNLVLQ